MDLLITRNTGLEEDFVLLAEGQGLVGVTIRGDKNRLTTSRAGLGLVSAGDAHVAIDTVGAPLIDDVLVDISLGASAARTGDISIS